MDAMIWIWLLVIIASIVVEISTTAMVSIWFVPGGVLCMLLAALHVAVWVQAVVFFVLSACLIIAFQCFFKNKLKTSDNKDKATDLDLVIGSLAMVSERIDNDASEGCVKLEGKYWSARSNDGSTIEVGEKVEIIAVSGVKLICRRII